MNLSQLSTEEIIHYIEAGIIENVPGEVVLEILEYYSSPDEVEEVSEDSYERGRKEGYSEGWNDCETDYLASEEG